VVHGGGEIAVKAGMAKPVCIANSGVAAQMPLAEGGKNRW
jgi:hypothetical protein